MSRLLPALDRQAPESTRRGVPLLLFCGYLALSAFLLFVSIRSQLEYKEGWEPFYILQVPLFQLFSGGFLGSRFALVACESLNIRRLECPLLVLVATCSAGSH